MAFMKKLSTARSQLTKSLNEIPIKWGRYIDSNMQEQKVIFFGHEKAIYGSDGVRLDEKLTKIEDGISGAFSEEKDYAVGDYCIFLNSLYRFISAKPAGPWDGAAVIPVSITQEIGDVRDEVGVINSNLGSVNEKMVKDKILEAWYRPSNLLELAAKTNAGGINFIETAGIEDTSLPDSFDYSYGFGLFGGDKRTIVLFSYKSTKIAVNSKHNHVNNWTGWKIYQ